MLTADFTNQFKKDYRLAIKRGLILTNFTRSFI